MMDERVGFIRFSILVHWLMGGRRDTLADLPFLAKLSARPSGWNEVLEMPFQAQSCFWACSISHLLCCHSCLLHGEQESEQFSELINRDTHHYFEL